jgi:starch synthase
MTKGAEPLNILFIAAEADPFIKVGGLGDVAGSLPLALHRIEDTYPSLPKLDIRLAIPYYGAIQNKFLKTKKIAAFPVNSIVGPITAEVHQLQHEGLTVYLVSGDPIRVEEPVYGTNFEADAEKFIFFSLACLQLPKVLHWKLDILHAHDWHTAVAVYQLEKLREQDLYYRKTRSVITLHNLPFIGTGSENALRKFDIQPSTDPTLPDWAKYVPFPMGLSAADRIVTVSPTYAKEIQTTEYGCGLQKFFISNNSKISGIVNGLDLKVWNPLSDPLIHQHYDNQSLQLRTLNKLTLQNEVGLAENSEAPLFILISRMDTQKGVDLAVEGLRLILDHPWQAILLGSGNKDLEVLCLNLERDFPDRVRSRIAFNLELSHRMYAGGDILLMPSRYEPCGLTQMIAMRYGCIPVARATGGLKDTIINIQDSANGNGYLFREPSPQGLSKSMRRALSDYKQHSKWNMFQQRAMEIDFSWQKSALAYSSLYRSLSDKIPITERRVL